MAENQPPSGRPRISRRRLVIGAGAVAAAAVAVAVADVHNAQAPTGNEAPTAKPGRPAASATSGPAQPTAVVTGSSLTDEVKLRHLLRRAGFGAGPTELAEYRKLGLTGAVDRLMGYEQVDNSALESRLQGLNLNTEQRLDLERWWLLRMIYTARPLEEKMTLFWHGLLTSALSKVGRPGLMRQQNDFFRKNALGSFPDILKAVSRDPAMMIWLDLNTDLKAHPNENYARELMELFSLGVGNYTEQDVREGARAYTGWSYRPLIGFALNKNQHDEGEKTFLGQTGNFDGDAIVDIIVKQPASARFIVGKMFGFFAYPNPSNDALEPLIESYVSNGYSIKALVRSIFTSEAFYSPQAYRALVKSPIEFVAGTTRLLAIETDGKLLPAACVTMGQEPFNPPNVAGWPGGASWLSSGTWLARLNFIDRVIATIPPVGGTQSGSQQAEANLLSAFVAASSPSDAVDIILDLFHDGQVSPAQRQVLIDYLTPPAGQSFTTASKAWLDERHRGIVYLAMAMPEYQVS